MILIRLIKNAEKLFADNSPAILTAIGVTGTITTAYLTGKATFKAADILFYECKDRTFKQDYVPISTRDKFVLCWQEYIPPVSSGLVTIAAIIAANRIGTRRAAAMAAAYGISEKAFSEYRDKVVEKFGENKERAVQDEVARDRIKNNPPTGEQVLIDGEVLCYDSYTGRYFKNNMEGIRKAQNDINYQINHNNYCSLGDFYDRLGLPGTAFSEEVGWNSDHLLEIQFSTVLADDGQPCLSMTFHVEPIRRYYKNG